MNGKCNRVTIEKRHQAEAIAAIFNADPARIRTALTLLRLVEEGWDIYRKRTLKGFHYEVGCDSEIAWLTLGWYDDLPSAIRAAQEHSEQKGRDDER